MKKKILIIDDDIQLNSFLVRFLSKYDMQAETAPSASEARSLIAEYSFDMIILDLNLPDADGLEIARDISQTHDIPIIILSVRSEIHDRILGLEFGADDYIPKPFEPRELLARINAVFRRAQTQTKKQEKSPHPTTEVIFGDFVMDKVARRLTRRSTDKPVPLTNSEFILLEALVAHAGELTSRDVIMDRLYGNRINVTDRAIDAHINRLRRKLEGNADNRSMIVSVHGKGYLLATSIAEQ